MSSSLKRVQAEQSNVEPHHRQASCIHPGVAVAGHGLPLHVHAAAAAAALPARLAPRAPLPRCPRSQARS